MSRAWFFVPASGDTTVDKLVGNLQTKGWGGDDADVVTPGDDVLTEVNDEQDPVLYIAGHGNFGQGIGTHKTHYGARRLVQLVIQAGLEKTQKNLTIHLVSCNSGASCRRKYFFAHRDPYVKRFAEALAAQQFTGITVVGYIGFVTSQLTSALIYNLRKNVKELEIKVNLNSAGGASRMVKYEVEEETGASKISGTDYESRTSVAPKTFRRIRIVR